jgi:hypothetical protein
VIPRLSIIVVSWNVAPLLRECLRSVAHEASVLPVEIIVVDNASSDDSVAMLGSEFPQVRVIANDDNRGFAGACNQGLQVARAPLVFLLNPDAVIVPGALRALIDSLSKHPDAGMLGPAVLNEDGSFQETAARLLPTLARLVASDVLRLTRLPLLGRWFRRTLVSPYDPDVTQEVQAISGAAMLIRRDLFEQCGGFGECFIHCGEDLDLCFRIRRTGWKIYFVPQARVVHLRGRSAQQTPVRTLVNGAISIQRYLDRCFGPWHGRIYRFCLQGIDAPAMILIGLVTSLLRLRPAGDLRLRLQYVRRIWSWRPM